tara:strand:- start:2241 stop:2810 length:570 start_codon:yes stop_codon:yes gene_type:complete
MKILIYLSALIFLTSCNKPKTVFLCGDHVCVNKTEAEQYFEENLTIEVKIIDKKENKKIDLVELNLEKESNGKRNVKIFSKNKIDNKIKNLSKNEVLKIKRNIKDKKKQNKIVKKINNNKELEKEGKIESLKKINQKNKIKKYKKDVNKNKNQVVDVCTILKKCSIDEIAKYLTEKSKQMDFPDITKRY